MDTLDILGHLLMVFLKWNQRLKSITEIFQTTLFSE